MKRTLLSTLTCFSILLSWCMIPPKETDACCMVPLIFTGGVSQSAQQGVLIHRDGMEDLILQIAYEIEPGENDELPEKLTWLIALPSEPVAEDGYALADALVFEELRHISRSVLIEWLRAVPQSNGRGLDNAADPLPTPEGVELGRRVEIGPYDIQPVRGIGEQAYTGLNTYLETRGFPTESEEHMAWFIEHGFTFLCIEVTPGEGEDALPADQPLPPLRVRFETEYPYYPLRYSSQQGDFELALFALTDRPIDLRASADVLNSIGWLNRPGEPAHTSPRGVVYAAWREPQEVETDRLNTLSHNLYGSEPSLLWQAAGDVLEQRETWHFAAFNARPNPTDRPITEWSGDCYFTLEGQDPAPLAAKSQY